MIGYLGLAARYLLGAVLLVSTGTKLLGFQAFLAWVRRLGVVGARRVPGVAVAMTAAEAVTLVLLFVPEPVAGPAAAAVLMAFFAGAAVFLVRRGITVPCRCFGAASAPIGVIDIARNTLLATVAALAATVAVLDPQPVPRVSAIVLAVLLGGTVGLVVTRLDDARQLFAK